MTIKGLKIGIYIHTYTNKMGYQSNAPARNSNGIFSSITASICCFFKVFLLEVTIAL